MTKTEESKLLKNQILSITQKPIILTVLHQDSVKLLKRGNSLLKIS